MPSDNISKFNIERDGALRGYWITPNKEYWMNKTSPITMPAYSKTEPIKLGDGFTFHYSNAEIFLTRQLVHELYSIIKDEIKSGVRRETNG